MPEFVHAPAVHAALSALRSNRQVLLNTAQAMMRADGAALYELDLIAFFGLKRAVATLVGFASLVEQHNMTCARPLLRIQIDNVLRFYAFSLVNEKAAREVLAGAHIRKIKDRDGQALTDAYLIAKLKQDLPWLVAVYAKTSGFVHLSAELAAVAVNDFNDEKREVQMAITEKDDLPERTWLETVACFQEATQLFAYLVDTWAEAKAVPRAQRSE